MNDMIKELYSIGLIPVIKIENAEDAVPLAKALIEKTMKAAGVENYEILSKNSLILLRELEDPRASNIQSLYLFR